MEKAQITEEEIYRHAIENLKNLTNEFREKEFKRKVDYLKGCNAYRKIVKQEPLPLPISLRYKALSEDVLGCLMDIVGDWKKASKIIVSTEESHTHNPIKGFWPDEDGLPNKKAPNKRSPVAFVNRTSPFSLKAGSKVNLARAICRTFMYAAPIRSVMRECVDLMKLFGEPVIPGKLDFYPFKYSSFTGLTFDNSHDVYEISYEDMLKSFGNTFSIGSAAFWGCIPTNEFISSFGMGAEIIPFICKQLMDIKNTIYLPANLRDPSTIAELEKPRGKYIQLPNKGILWNHNKSELKSQFSILQSILLRVFVPTISVIHANEFISCFDLKEKTQSVPETIICEGQYLEFKNKDQPRFYFGHDHDPIDWILGDIFNLSFQRGLIAKPS